MFQRSARATSLASRGGPRRPRHLTIAVLSALIASLFTLVASAPSAFAGNEPPFGTLQVAGSSWLQGAGVVDRNGVNSYSNGDTSYVSRDYSTPAVGMRWQCIELAQRLYQDKGWSSGRWGVNAYGIYGLAGFQSHPNNGTYTPVPGDMIIHGTSDPGHVAIVDRISGNTLYAVEQNVASIANNNGVATYTISNGVLSRSGLTLPIRGIVHDPDNPNTNSASASLNARDLAFVKWAPTGSGRIEVHTATAASGYAGFGVHAATPIGAGDTNGVFDMADVNADGRSDLVYIKRRNTGSGRIEVHWVNAASGYSSFGGNIATVFSAADDPNGSFEMADMNGDGRADLVFTKTRNTGSGRIELHWADAASGYGRFGANLATAFSLADAGNGYFHPADMNADGRVDLAFVKIRNTGSGRIEVHWANAAGGYGSFGGNFATALSGAERANGSFETVDMNGDRRADLVFLKDYNVGSGRIELHWLDASAGFSRVTFSAATAFSAAEAGHGFFTMMA